MKYEIIIIGGGPAGITAGIYALRANKKILILEKTGIGGKIISSPLIENYPGIKEIKGLELSENLYKQIIELGGEIKNEEVIKIEDQGKIKKVITKNETYECIAIIIATGTQYKTLGLEKEEQFIGKGISFCAVCDGNFYKGKAVAVIGGGNTAITNALELTNICEKVYIIQISDSLTAEPILINQLKEKQNVEILYKTSIKRIIGEEKLSGIEIEKNGQNSILTIDGVFVSIGQIPETNIAKQAKIEVNQEEYINVNENYMTNQKGIFAAGDCTSKKVRQLTTAVNDGTIAALTAIEYINHLSY